MPSGTTPLDALLVAAALAACAGLAVVLGAAAIHPLALVLLLFWIPCALIAYRLGTARARQARPDPRGGTSPQGSPMAVATHLLAGARTAREVAEIVLVQTIGRLTGHCGLFALPHEEAAEAEIVTVGFPEDAASSLARAPADADLPVVRALASDGGPAVIRHPQELARYPHLVRVGTRTHVVVPVRAGSRTLGAFACGFPTERGLAPDELAFLESLAREAGAALDRVRIQEVERRAQLKVEQANARLEFLARAGTVLATSTDLQGGLEKIVNLAVGVLGDGCVAYLLADDGRVVRAASAHADPVKNALLVDLHERYPIDLTQQAHPVVQVIRQGRPLLVPQVSAEMLERIAPDRLYPVMARPLAPGSALLVPLLTEGRAIGALAFGWFAPDRVFTRTDQALAEALAARVAQFVQTSRAYQRERARLLEGIQRAKQEAESSAARERFQRTLLDTVAHDLKTPLTSIIGSLSVLRDAEPRRQDDVRELAGVAFAEAQRLLRFVTNILQMSRLEEGTLRVRRRPSDVLQLVRAAALQLGDVLKDRPLQVDGPPTVPLVPADGTLLVQVFTNLIDNAVRYSPPGTPVDVRVSPGTQEMVITIADRGPGIPGWDLARFLEKHRRLARSEVQGGGSGMGLAIARGIVQAHAGRIWAERREGGGTAVSIALPMH